MKPPRMRQHTPVPRVRSVAALAYSSVHASAGASVSREGIPTGTFRRQLDVIRLHGDPVTTIRDLCRANDGTRPAARSGQAVVLTFDGGYASHADPVLGLLWDRRMTGEFFVNPALVGRRGFLSWNELRGMATAGMSIQSQGYSCRPLDALTPRELMQELERSKAVIEDRLGQAVSVYATPLGHVSPAILGKARAAGYRAVCTHSPGYWQPGAGNAQVSRLVVRASAGENQLRNWLQHRPLTLIAERCRHAARFLVGPPPVNEHSPPMRRPL